MLREDQGNQQDGGHGGRRAPAFVRDEALEHPLRMRTVDTLAERPGMNKNQLCEELGIHWNLLDFHLECLEDADLVVTRPSAQEREVLCFRYEDADLWENERTRILFGRAPTRHVGLYLAENPGATAQQIGRALGIAAVTVRHHLETLADHDLIDRFRVGRKFLYEADEELTRWADSIGRPFERPWESHGSR